jgi:hypothetical protein
MIRAVKRLLLAMLVVILFASSLYLDNNIPETNAATPLSNYELYSDGEAILQASAGTELNSP